MKRLLTAAGFFATLFFLACSPALAQEGEASPADSPTGWIFRWLNFAIVFGAIAYFAVKKGRPYFRENAAAIAAKIAEGARARDAAEEHRREIDAKMADLDKEIAAMREEAKRDADAEGKRLRALARQEAERIEQTAQAEITAAERAARLELKALAARLALERAQSLLEKELTPQVEAGLFRAFVQDLGGRVN
ncbi:MAG TPA: ATP synthase F0 subunit B [Candidatus Acidoferrum sp.]|nr:ATP synthase F0 subunit B [Candidatus Acidoferrum sp.]